MLTIRIVSEGLTRVLAPGALKGSPRHTGKNAGVVHKQATRRATAQGAALAADHADAMATCIVLDVDGRRAAELLDRRGHLLPLQRIIFAYQRAPDSHAELLTEAGVKLEVLLSSHDGPEHTARLHVRHLGQSRL